MENPATWGKAEQVVNEVLKRIDENSALPPDQRRIGLSRARQITDALRVEGLLVSDG